MKKFILFALAACTTLFAQEPAQEAAAAPAAETATVATTASEAATAPETAAASPAASAVTDSAATITDTGNAQTDEANAQEVAALSTTEAKPQLVSRRNTQDKPDEDCILCNEVQNAIGDSLGKKWRHLIGVAFTVPISQYKINKEKLNFVNFGVNVSYMGVSRFGFATRATVSAGISVTDDIKFEDSDDSEMGSYGALELGAGFCFVNSPIFTFAVFAMVGMEYAMFETDENAYDHEELGAVDRSFTETAAGITLGGDIVMRLALTERVGIFASVGGRWVASSGSETTVKYRKGDYTRTESYLDDGRGVFSIVPAFGVMWRF